MKKIKEYFRKIYHINFHKNYFRNFYHSEIAQSSQKNFYIDNECKKNEFRNNRKIVRFFFSAMALFLWIYEEN